MSARMLGEYTNVLFGGNINFRIYSVPLSSNAGRIYTNILFGGNINFRIYSVPLSSNAGRIKDNVYTLYIYFYSFKKKTIIGN